MSTPFDPQPCIVAPPEVAAFDFSIAKEPGTVAAKNYISIMNPVGSTKLVSLTAIFLSNVSVNPVTSTDPMRGHRITSHSGGVLHTDADVVKLDTASDDPLLEIRTGNPTVGGMGPGFFNSPSIISTGVGGSAVHTVEPPPGPVTFRLYPGEGVVVRTEAGDVDQLWNLTIVWGEIG